VVEAEKLTDPVVRQFVEAANAGDREAFFALLTPNASMSDDGTERDLRGVGRSRDSPRMGAWRSSRSRTTSAR
jgi:hypothetical protein